MGKRDMARVAVRALISRLIPLAAILFTIVLAACDGGGGDGPAY